MKVVYNEENVTCERHRIMRKKKSDSTVLYEIVKNDLPGFCAGYLINRENERSIGTRLGYARNLKTFFEYVTENMEEFKNRDVTEIHASEISKITPREVDEFLAEFALERKPATAARMKSSISSMYAYAANTLQEITYNATLGTQKIKKQEKDFVTYLTVEEQDRLLDCIRYGTGLTKREQMHHGRYEKRDLAIVFLLLDTGLRVSELREADNRDLNLEACSIIVTRKGGKHSEVYFSDEAAYYLKDYIEEKKILHPAACGPADPLILSRDEGRLTVRQYENIIPKYVHAALPERYESINCHKLRSSFAMTFYMRDAEKGGRDLLALQQRMNHKSLTTTNVYAKAAGNISKQTRNWREGI